MTEPLPDGLEALLDPEQLRTTDAWAIETLGIPGVELMERAGEGLFEIVWHRAPPGGVVVVCGGGNNGGDEPPTVRLTGAAERRARELGATVSVSLTHQQGMAAAVAVTE